jgi:hypothetical protein
MTFHLFRSRSFWLGLPGLIFLLWAWGDSLSSLSSLSRNTSPGGGIAQQEGSIVLHYWNRFPFDPGGFQLKREALKREPFELPGFMWDRTEGWESDEGWGWRILAIPHWFVIAIYFLIWAALIQLRRRRHAASSQL